MERICVVRALEVFKPTVRMRRLRSLRSARSSRTHSSRRPSYNFSEGRRPPAFVVFALRNSLSCRRLGLAEFAEANGLRFHISAGVDLQLVERVIEPPDRMCAIDDLDRFAVRIGFAQFETASGQRLVDVV